MCFVVCFVCIMSCFVYSYVFFSLSTICVTYLAMQKAGAGSLSSGSKGFLKLGGPNLLNDILGMLAYNYIIYFQLW